jgi:hypothetical protein
MEIITFYDVPLVCGAAPAIGCGSRAKPFLMDLEQRTAIKEAWLNRAGTIVAIVWSGPARTEAVLNIYQKRVGTERTAEVQAHGIQNPFDRANRKDTLSCCP